MNRPTAPDSGLPPSLVRDFTDALRAEIFAGRKEPSARLNLDDLRAEFGMSLSPIREGLARLATEGFVVPVGQRGYRVAPISIAEQIDLQGMRTDLELKALRLAIERGGENWENALVAAYRGLKRFESQRWTAEGLEDWERRHHVFHEVLISACESPILIRFCAVLLGMSDRYRRVVLKASGPAPGGLEGRAEREHQEIFEAAMDRDADRACEALRGHIARTTENVLKAMESRARQE